MGQLPYIREAVDIIRWGVFGSILPGGSGCCLGYLRGAAAFNNHRRGSGFGPIEPSAHGGGFGYSQEFEGPENGIFRIVFVSGINPSLEKAL